MQMEHALFQAIEGRGGFLGGDVYFFQIVGVRGLHQACAPDDGTVRAHAAPEIGEIDCVEGLSLRKAGGCENFFADRTGEDGESEGGMHAGDGWVGGAWRGWGG